jgi:molybdenum ABC transporter molybdate-binding protein
MRSIALGSVLLAALLSWWVLRADVGPATGTGHTLTVHCAAGIKGPVTKAAKEYEQQFGNRVELTFGGSGALLSALTVRNHGDIYIAGDDSYVSDAKQRGLVAEILALASMHPVIAVRSGNPKNITSYRDLLRLDVRTGLGNPEAAAVGKIAKRVATDLGFWDQLRDKVTVMKPTVNDLGNDLQIGTIDAAVIWDSTVRQYEDLEIVEDPQLSRQARKVTLGVLRCTTQPRPALHFARYLAAHDRGLLVFSAEGFTPIDGDEWADVPQLELMSGAMLRPAIDSTVTAFEQREGVRVNRVYNGCGILVSQMKTGSIPDAYFSCDQTFLDQVQDRFQDGVTVTANDIVMLLRKGNPKNIAKLRDLLRPGVRVGLGHPEKSALGALTTGLLSRTGHLDNLKASGNVVVESATGDLLVNQITAGSLDVVLVYRSNTAHVGERCEVAPIQEATSQAHQPFAIAKDSAHPHLMRRLLDTLRGADSRRRFEELGFHWRAGERPK